MASIQPSVPKPLPSSLLCYGHAPHLPDKPGSFFCLPPGGLQPAKQIAPELEASAGCQPGEDDANREFLRDWRPDLVQKENDNMGFWLKLSEFVRISDRFCDIID